MLQWVSEYVGVSKTYHACTVRYCKRRYAILGLGVDNSSIRDHIAPMSTQPKSKQSLSTELSIQTKLLTWFQTNRRTLPWREQPTAYRIWLSEIMAQQTRLATVVPYFTAFCERFPALASLCDAQLDDVLKMWAGLGYYNRARNLFRTAKIVYQDHAGEWPQDPAQLEKLPGIGHYTARAIASIAFGKRVPVMDGNVLRVASRLFDIDQDVQTKSVQHMIENRLMRLLPQRQPGTFNEAIMELGALVCTPGEPSCMDCPLSAECLAHQNQTQELRPVRPKGKPPQKIDVAALFLQRSDGAFLMVRDLDRGLFRGLWGFPMIPSDGRARRLGTTSQLTKTFSRKLKIGLDLGEILARPQHTLTHRQLCIRLYTASCHDQARLDENTHQWIMTEKQLCALPLSRLTDKLLDSIPQSKRPF